MIDVVGKRDLAQLRRATRRATARAVSSLAASRRGLAFERAHFSPDPLNGGSPDADGRGRLVNARAAPQKSLDLPFRLDVDPRPPNRFAALGNPTIARRSPMLFRNLYRCASCSGRMAGCVECYMRRRLPALRRAHSCRGGPGVRISGVKILPEAREVRAQPARSGWTSPWGQA
jgi:hypothetical protein